jgi:PAS domain S-box-containing protein
MLTEEEHQELDSLRKELKNERREKNSLLRKIRERDNIIASYENNKAFKESLYSVVKEQSELQNTYLQRMLENSASIIVLMDENRKFITGTVKNMRKFGVNTDSLSKVSDCTVCFINVLPEESISRLQTKLKEVMESGESQTYNSKIWIKGTNLYFTVAIIPFKDDSNAIIGAMIQIHNITEMQRALEAAERANLAKTNFLATMSHEIRTPMNTVIGLSELATMDDVSPKTKEYLNKIMDNSKWLLQIINDILDISKIESGKMELETIPFDLREIFTNCRTITNQKAIEKGIVLHFYAEPAINKKLLGDPTKLRQVFINLISNAIKFTDAGGLIKISAVVKNITPDNCTVRFEVRDNGIGMTQEQTEKIFEPFVQVDSGTVRKYGGTGLGLAIAKNIVEIMGGFLVLESKPGVGSKFGFEITFKTTDKASSTYSGSLSHAEVERPVFTGEVLICEDNKLNQRVIFEHLSKVGLQSVIAGNGREAVDTVRNRIEKGGRLFDLIFMDVQMPVMDGIEAASKITEFNTGIPIVALTANIMAEDIGLYRKSGMMSFLGKPFMAQELWSCLLQYLKPVKIERKGRNFDDNLQKELMADFAKSNKNRFNEISRALKLGDIQLAHRLVHTLKSNAALFGKTKLQKAAANVELILRHEEHSLTQEHLKILKTELSEVLKEFAPLLKKTAKPVARGEPLDNEKIKDLLEQLEPLLKSGNPNSLGFIEDLRSVPGSKKLIEQIEDFDFKPAFATLEKIKKTWV